MGKEFSNSIKLRTITPSETLLQALKKMDAIDKKLLLVMEHDIFFGLISIGDIQRAIIKNESLETPVSNLIRKNLKIAHPGNSYDEIRAMMLQYRMELLPVVDEQNKLVNIYLWEDEFQEKNPSPAKKFDLPVVVMAGGFGTRLKPLTNVLPKPLIPIGEKSMLEEIFDRFFIYGTTRFYISVNYKADMIEFYIKELALPYTLKFFREEKPLGTAGSLHLIENQIKETFFVTNCDILIEQDYSEILEYHRENNNELTIVAALKHYPIPYGIVDTGKNGLFERLREKPELTFKINSGMYVLEPHLLREIPQNKFFHITSLIEKIKKRNGKIGVFPVSEKSWKDIGNWKEYINEFKYGHIESE